MKWLYGIAALGIIVFIHELGHFLAAKLCGVEVLSFSLGYGPSVLHKKVRGTDYRLSLFPLGGYCGMKGEGDFREAMDEGRDEIAKTPGSLYAVHPLLRAAIGAAGPLFNMIFAAAALSLIALMGYSYKSYAPCIRLADEVFEGMHSAARDGGVLTGDVIKEIDGESIISFADVYQAIASRPNKDVNIVVERAGKVLHFIVHTDEDKKQGIGKIGVTVFSNALITFDVPSMSLHQAALYGIREAWDMAAVTVKAVMMLFRGIDLKSSVSGPARITDMLGTAAKEGFSEGVREGAASVLELMAVISVSLFVMNLLPIPILDGGLVLFALIAFCFKKEIKPKIQYRAQIAGIAVIALLFAAGIFSDVSYFMKN